MMLLTSLTRRSNAKSPTASVDLKAVLASRQNRMHVRAAALFRSEAFRRDVAPLLQKSKRFSYRYTHLLLRFCRQLLCPKAWIRSTSEVTLRLERRLLNKLLLE